MATRSELIDLAVSRGLTLDEAESLTNDELQDMYGDEPAYQDQGSLDEPVQSTNPTESASDLGTPELRAEAERRVVTGVNRPRERFPWEVGPPKR